MIAWQTTLFLGHGVTQSRKKALRCGRCRRNRQYTPDQKRKSWEDLHTAAPFFKRGKTGVTADRDKIELRLFDSSSIFNITLREELFSLPKQNQTMYSYPGFNAHNQGNSGLQLLSKEYLFAKGYIKDRTRIKQPKLNLVTVGRDSSFPSKMSNMALNPNIVDKIQIK